MKCYKAMVRVTKLEGLPPTSKTLASINVKWKQQLQQQQQQQKRERKFFGRKKDEFEEIGKSNCMTQKRVVDEQGVVQFEEHCFENLLCFKDDDGDDDAWDVSFSILHGSSNIGEKLEEIGMVKVNISEWVNDYEKSNKFKDILEMKVFRKEIPVAIRKNDMAGYAMLHVTVSLTEVEEVSSRKIYGRSNSRRSVKTFGLCSLTHPQVDDDKIQQVTGNNTAKNIMKSSSIKRLLSWKKRKVHSKNINFQEETNTDVKTSSSQDGENECQLVTWESKEFLSRNRKVRLKVDTFFASFDQRDPRVGGEIACSAIVAVVAGALHANGLKMPSGRELDTLIREGSQEWKKLCETEKYLQRFPDRHFDLETVVEAWVRPILVSHEKSFVGFFEADKFKSLQNAMSFDEVWRKISDEAEKGGNPKVYIVGWNDHFFLLKADSDAFYVIDTLGERLYEGCDKAYVLRFDESTEIAVKSDIFSEEICRGKECCREFIVRFLAGIPVFEALDMEWCGNGTVSELHRRLQIEFQLTEACNCLSLDWSVGKENEEGDRNVGIEHTKDDQSSQWWSSDYSWSTLNSTKSDWLSEYSFD